MPPISTGIVVTRRAEEISSAHASRGIWDGFLAFARAAVIDATKLAAVISDDTHTKHTANITQSTDAPEWNVEFDSGGYKVQPVAGP